MIAVLDSYARYKNLLGVPTTVNERLDDSLTAQRLSFDSIPIVSLAPWFLGGTNEQVEVADRINSICRNVGFMYISDHGIPQSMLRSVFDAAQQFFALSDDEKADVHYSKSELPPK